MNSCNHIPYNYIIYSTHCINTHPPSKTNPYKYKLTLPSVLDSSTGLSNVSVPINELVVAYSIGSRVLTKMVKYSKFMVFLKKGTT